MSWGYEIEINSLLVHIKLESLWIGQAQADFPPDFIKENNLNLISYKQANSVMAALAQSLGVHRGFDFYNFRLFYIPQLADMPGIEVKIDHRSQPDKVSRMILEIATDPFTSATFTPQNAIQTSYEIGALISAVEVCLRSPLPTSREDFIRHYNAYAGKPLAIGDLPRREFRQIETSQRMLVLGRNPQNELVQCGYTLSLHAFPYSDEDQSDSHRGLYSPQITGSIPLRIFSPSSNSLPLLHTLYSHNRYFEKTRIEIDLLNRAYALPQEIIHVVQVACGFLEPSIQKQTEDFVSGALVLARFCFGVAVHGAEFKNSSKNSFCLLPKTSIGSILISPYYGPGDLQYVCLLTLLRCLTHAIFWETLMQGMPAGPVTETRCLRLWYDIDECEDLQLLRPLITAEVLCWTLLHEIRRHTESAMLDFIPPHIFKRAKREFHNCMNRYGISQTRAEALQSAVGNLSGIALNRLNYNDGPDAYCPKFELRNLTTIISKTSIKDMIFMGAQLWLQFEFASNPRTKQAQDVSASRQLLETKLRGRTEDIARQSSERFKLLPPMLQSACQRDIEEAAKVMATQIKTATGIQLEFKDLFFDFGNTLANIQKDHPELIPAHVHLIENALFDYYAQLKRILKYYERKVRGE